MIEWQLTPWMTSTLPHDKALEWAKAKVHVYSASVLRLGKMHRHPDAMVMWKEQLRYVRIPMNTENYLESTETHLSSSGIFSQDTLQWYCSTRFKQ